MKKNVLQKAYLFKDLFYCSGLIFLNEGGLIIGKARKQLRHRFVKNKSPRHDTTHVSSNKIVQEQHK